MNWILKVKVIRERRRGERRESHAEETMKIQRYKKKNHTFIYTRIYSGAAGVLASEEEKW